MVSNSVKNIDFLIKNKDQVNDNDLAILFNLTIEYPYSSFCHYLVYAVLKIQNRTGFENMLKKTAIRFHDRNLLKKLSQDFLSSQINEKRKPISNDNKIPIEEDAKKLNENIFSNIINENLIQEIEELKEDSVHNESKEKIKRSVKSNQYPKSFEDWLYKHPQNKSEKEITVDEILNSLENRKKKNTKSSFFSASNAAKKSLETNDDFVTETLAEIHIQQGNYPKAIEIYQKLILLNPEKKLFFASRIEFINQKTQL